MALSALSAAASAAPPAAPSRRAELDALQSTVEAAVMKVSRPAGLMFGRQSRAYHLQGYGAFVVLAPRALPRNPRVAGAEARAFADLVRRLEESVGEVRDPAEQRRLQEMVAALRAGGPPAPPTIVARRAHPPRDAASMQETAEAFRREAERAMQRAERDVRVRLRLPEDGREPLPSEPVIAPVPPAPPMPPAPPARRIARVPSVPPVPEMAFPPFPPAPPGWSFAFDEPLVDEIAPERVVADVRGAIVAGLGAYRGALTVLGPDEFVVVAVDFVPRMADHARPRTVVARVRKRDLAEHRAGRLTAEALHARIAFDEY